MGSVVAEVLLQGGHDVLVLDNLVRVIATRWWIRRPLRVEFPSARGRNGSSTRGTAVAASTCGGIMSNQSFTTSGTSQRLAPRIDDGTTGAVVPFPREGDVVDQAEDEEEDDFDDDDEDEEEEEEQDDEEVS